MSGSVGTRIVAGVTLAWILLVVAVVIVAATGCSITFLHKEDYTAPPSPLGPAPTPEQGLLYCDRDHACHCWICSRFEDERSAVCVQKYYVPCPKAGREDR